jgi:uncharacterized protein
VHVPSTGSGLERERQAFPDQLRALALLGIVVVNAPFMAIGIDGFTEASTSTALDRIAAFGTTMLAEGKFYILFSFLFGYSANFIVKKGDPASRRRWKRRLAGLAVIGLAHAIFLFIGDILFAYAVLGSGLILMFNRRDRTVLVTAAISALIGIFWLALLVLLSAVVPEEIASDPTLDSLDIALASGSFFGAAEARLEALPLILLTLGTLQWPLAFASFCVGLVAGRHRLLADLGAKRPTWRRMAVWGLAIGLPVQLAGTWLVYRDGFVVGTGFESMLGLAVIVATAPILSAGYMGALALLSQNLPRILATVQDPGRASLSIYIGESLILATLFCGWGFGLFGQLGAAAVTGVAILTWVLLVIAMNLWLGRFRQGPLEAPMSLWTGKAGSSSLPTAQRLPEDPHDPYR